jgi:tetratricopeptide (TPR) repeat protein
LIELKQKSSKPQYFVQLAKVYLALGDVDAAENILKEGLTEEVSSGKIPNDVQIGILRTYLGVTYYARYELDKAHIELEQAMNYLSARSNPFVSVSITHYAIILGAQQNYARALSLLETAISSLESMFNGKESNSYTCKIQLACALRVLASLKGLTGNSTERIHILTRVVSLLTKLDANLIPIAPGHPQLLVTLLMLYATYSELGVKAKMTAINQQFSSFAKLDDIFSMLAREFGPTHPEVSYCRHMVSK